MSGVRSFTVQPTLNDFQETIIALKALPFYFAYSISKLNCTHKSFGEKYCTYHFIEVDYNSTINVNASNDRLHNF